LFNDEKIFLIFFSRFTGYLKKIYPEDQKMLVKGKIEFYKNKYQLSHPEIINRNSLIDNRLHQIVYKQRKNLKSETIHSIILNTFASISELKEWNIKLLKFYKKTPSFKESIVNIHNPKTENALSVNSPFIIRLAYDEIFSYQLSLAILRHNLNKLHSNNFNINTKEVIDYVKKLLPFKLTKDQVNCANEIIEDIKSKKRTLRLLQGDVGCGKTAVAIMSAYYVLKSGYQVVLLAPTELLAKQHYNFFSKIFSTENINTALLFASTLNKQNIKKDLSNGTIKLVIGTHALLQADVKFKNLSFAIIDEQHRFGVEQRIKLSKKGDKVDMLLLTATPIPRTMMLTVLGDISVSTIHMKPFNSKTKTILKSEENIDQVISFLNQRISLGKKVFWVCPRIEDEKTESDANVEQRYAKLNKIFKKSAMLHGKMSSSEKSFVLDKFRKGHLNLIISTVVIEVGIDIPDANIIVIDNANTFGLAQIHQLRGRVGRGENEGICVLLYKNNLSDIALERLSILKESQDGFKIAEKDLQLRGAGEILGTRQYGAEEFKFFNYENHIKLSELAINEARSIIKADPRLETERGKILINFLKLFKKNDATNLLSAG
ncbi:MAG: ATP-dependent DNA helicase RecG, partial [Alphaproteobacteria bacterium MarineAlpha9_Bin4]